MKFGIGHRRQAQHPPVGRLQGEELHRVADGVGPPLQGHLARALRAVGLDAEPPFEKVEKPPPCWPMPSLSWTCTVPSRTRMCQGIVSGWLANIAMLSSTI